MAFGCGSLWQAGSAVVHQPSLQYARSTVKGFFRMDRGEAAVLVFLVLFSAFSFLPVWRTVELAGMAVFGWLMAALMVISPALALTLFLLGRRRR